MLLTRNQFFLVLSILLLGAFYVPRLLWLSRSNGLLPQLVLLIIFITPGRFDPLIPWKASVRIGVRPFLKIIPSDPEAKN